MVNTAIFNGWSLVQLEPEHESMSGARGLLCKRTSEGNIDEDAGFIGRSDLKIQFGHPEYSAGDTMIEAEFKNLAVRDNLAWYDQHNSLLAQILQPLIGEHAFLSAAILSNGLKVIMLEDPQSCEEFHQMHLWPPGAGMPLVTFSFKLLD